MQDHQTHCAADREKKKLQAPRADLCYNLRLACTGAMALVILTSCQFLDFFKSKKSQSSGAASPATVLGQNLGQYAGGQDDAALAALYDVNTAYAPAPIRPDPDTYVRLLLRQYHNEDITIAQQIGNVEAYRELLGGASADFSVAPQSTYDATSLLASIKVAEEICTGLVAPSPDVHGEWQSILPYPPDDARDNVRYLAQRFIGLPGSRISNDIIEDLMAILEDAAGGDYSYGSYVAVCMTLAVDAEALLL